MLVVVSGTTRGTAMTAARDVVDPTQATVRVTTDETTRGPISAAARTEAEFISTWAALVGRGTKTGRT